MTTINVPTRDVLGVASGMFFRKDNDWTGLQNLQSAIMGHDLYTLEMANTQKDCAQHLFDQFPFLKEHAQAIRKSLGALVEPIKQSEIDDIVAQHVKQIGETLDVVV